MKVSIGPYRKNRKIEVRIDAYDVWNMDHTLALIILPMLKQLKESKMGAPFVDDEDVPEELKTTTASPKENEWDTDENWFKRWDFVLDEMIFAFSYHVDADADDMEQDDMKMNRVRKGTILFGKYYTNLWN